MAVLNFMASMSSDTFLMARWTASSFSAETSAPSFSFSLRFHTRSRNFLQPRTDSSDQVAVFSKSPMNMIYRRMVSAP